MRFLNIGDKSINMDLVVEVERRSNGHVIVSFAAPQGANVYSSTFTGSTADALVQWLDANGDTLAVAPKDAKTERAVMTLLDPEN